MRQSRKQKGAGIAIITLLIGAILISSLGLFTFEMIRHNTAFDELRSACEAAALAGASAMASSDNMNTVRTHENAIKAAQHAFEQNSILGLSCKGADKTSLNAGNFNTFAPPPDKTAMMVEFLDPNNNNQVVTDLANPNGRIVKVSAVFTNRPPFGQFLGLPAVPMRTRADSRVPQLDVVLVFDTSGSIDDQTPVTLVRRIWNGTRNVYQIMTAKGGSPTGALCQGRIYDIFEPGPTGTSVQGCGPQNCSDADRSDHVRKYTWSQDMRTPENGQAKTDTWAQDRFSDLVVNLDGKNVFNGYSITVGGVTYDFPDVGTLVEAARGNLENNTVFNNSKANVSLPMAAPGNGSITPKAGYRAAYEQAALMQTQPIGAARVAATQFFQIMNNNTDAHFGFVSFNDNGYTTTSNRGPRNIVDYNYGGGGTVTYPQPGVQLELNADKLTDCITAVTSTRADGGTNMGDALQKAVDQLKKTSGRVRPNARRAIVFFTDGQPTVPSKGSRAWETPAAVAKQEGITIYTVGLAQNSAIIPAECEHLNQAAGQPINYVDPITNANGTYTPSMSGMAAQGAQGGQFFLVTNSANLRYVFENIARNLVQLVKS